MRIKAQRLIFLIAGQELPLSLAMVRLEKLLPLANGKSTSKFCEFPTIWCLAAIQIASAAFS